MTRKLAPFDAAKYLTNRKVIAAYVTEALESGDAELVAIAIGDVARARGMTEIAKEAGLSREHLYRALSAGGNPEFGTVLKALSALGMQLTAKPS
jgi:probable addiction module antidote protein